MRLPRPHIPLEVRCRVVLRQLGEMWPEQVIEETRDLSDPTVNPMYRRGFRRLLDDCLARLSELLACEVKDLRLDHNPALGAREKIKRSGEIVGYKPHANDPEYLIYREAHAHHIKTQIHGDGAQYPDRVLIKRQRRRENGVRTKPKTRWASRPLRSASRWPSRPFPKA